MESDGAQFTIALDGTVDGLCLGKERAQSVVVTCPHSGVKIFEVFDRQCLKNWTCPTQLQLRGAASQDPKSRRFYAIVGPQTVSSWGHNALDITSRLDRTMDSEVFCVHTPAGKRKKWSAVVVMKNENIHLLDHKMAVVASYQGPEHVVDWSHLVCIDDDDYVLTLFHNEDTGSYFLHVFSLHNEPCIRDRSRFDLRVKYTRYDNTCPLLSASFQPDSPPYLALLWANRKLNVWQWESVAHLTNSEMAPHSALRTEVLEMQVAPPAEGSTVNRGAYLFAVNSNLLLLLGYNTNEQRLEVRSMHIEWNTVLDLLPVPVEGVDGSAITGAVYDKEGSYLVIALPRQLCIMPIPEQRGTLGDVMGSAHKQHVAEHEAHKNKKPSFRTLPPMVDASIGTALFGESSHLHGVEGHTGRLPPAFLKDFAQDNVTEYSVVQLLTDPELTPTQEDVEELFFAYMNQCPFLPIQAGEASRTASSSSLFFPSTQQTIPLVQEIAQAKKRKVSARLAGGVALRCLASQCWAPLRYLLVHGLLSYSLVQENLFSVLMEHKQIELLHISLLQLQDLDERSIVQLIKWFMDHHRAPFIVDYLRSALRLSSSDPATTEALDGYQFLNLIVNLPINEAFTVRSLSRLETKYATNVLSYLLKYLQLYSHNPLQGMDVQLIALPVYENVLCWTTMMIDAQASSLLLAEDDTMLLLAHIKQEIRAQVDLCEHLQPMRGWLFHVLNRLAIPSSSLQNYSIESFYA